MKYPSEIKRLSSSVDAASTSPLTGSSEVENSRNTDVTTTPAPTNEIDVGTKPSLPIEEGNLASVVSAMSISEQEAQVASKSPASARTTEPVISEDVEDLEIQFLR